MALHALTRRVRQLERVSSQCVFYERHEVIDAQGQRLSRDERGSPFVYRKGLGLVPVDPERPLLDDGSVVSQTTIGYTDANGCWHRVVQYRRLPGPGLQSMVGKRATLEVSSPEQQAQALSLLTRDQVDPVPVAIVLRDRQAVQELPPRAMTGLAFSEHHRPDTLTPLRRRLRAQNRAQRQREARPLRAWIRSVGGAVGHHATLYGSVLSAQVPRKHLPALLARSEVAQVERRAAEEEIGLESDVTTEYLCSNLPSPYDPTVDASQCEPETDATGATTVRFPYLDAANAATGVLDYHDARIMGQIGGGLSNWGHEPTKTVAESPTLTYGLRDPQYADYLHPAFLWRENSRFQFLLRAEAETAEIDTLTGTAIRGRSASDPDKGHATRCAAVAMANSYLYGDSALASRFARGARTGVARLVTALHAAENVKIYEMLDIVGSGALGEEGDVDPPEGIDVISSSFKEGHGEEAASSIDVSKTVRCPSESDARGLDIGSQSVVYAYRNDQVVFVKAAGNDHGALGWCDYPVEVSPPGASPAAISVGALEAEWMSAEEMQDAEYLRTDSSGDLTLDGRSYPSLATLNRTCGCADTESSADLSRDNGYGRHGQTSSAAPRVAGTALLFKHWYLEHYGSLANHAGRIIVNVLHFADGFVRRNRTSLRTLPPTAAWGLGRLRMRLYTDAQDDTGPTWGTTQCVVWTGSATTIDLLGGAATFPSNVRHLRITAWWLEVNIGRTDTKAGLSMALDYTDWSGAPRSDVADSDSQHVMRMQYDKHDTRFPCPPAEGAVTLTLFGNDVPWEARSGFYWGGPVLPYRVVYVAWSWDESRYDSTNIQCDWTEVGSPWCHEDTVPFLTAPASSGTAEFDRRRRCTEEALRGAMRIATGAAPVAGTSPVGPGGRFGKAPGASVMPASADVHIPDSPSRNRA